MLISGPSTLPSCLDCGRVNVFARRRHGQDDGTNGSPDRDDGGGEGPGDEIVTPSTAATDPSSTQPLASSTSLSSNPIASSNSGVTTLQFLNVQNATTCQSYRVWWNYTGPHPSSDIILSIDQNPMGLTSLDPNDKPPSVPTRTLSSNISSTATDFTWGLVDLEQGSYMLGARVATPDQRLKFVCQPTHLYVVNGTDTSCVKSFQPATDSRPRLSNGDVVGIIVGAIAAAGLLALAFIFPRLWRRDLPSPKRRRPYYLY